MTHPRHAFDELMFAAFPEFFQHRVDPKQRLMADGFRIGPGWHGTVEGLLRVAADLQSRYDRIEQKGEPVLQSRLRMHLLNLDVARLEARSSLEVEQVKQKGGGLRFYYCASGMAPLAGAVELAEFLAWRTCEECGCPGRLQETQTRCDACYLQEDS